MHYLYHGVPENMDGNILYPLNILKSIKPNLYTEAIKKYSGREDLMQSRIPLLNCLWNDVIHLTAVHPSEINRTLRAADNTRVKRSFYEIDPGTLDLTKTIVYLYKSGQPNESIDADEFEWFDASKLGNYSVMPEALKEYYKDAINKKQEFFLFHMTPHIFYKGEIDISNAKIVS